MYCIVCTKTLTPEEAYYYGDKCTDCECDEFERYQRWLAGEDDPEFDSLYS